MRVSTSRHSVTLPRRGSGWTPSVLPAHVPLRRSHVAHQQAGSAMNGCTPSSTPSSDEPLVPPAPQESLPRRPGGESAEPQRPWWKPPKVDKEMIAALGFGAFCAYGVISNVNAGILITIAWLTVVKTTGTMPTATGNWPTFLAVYAGES